MSYGVRFWERSFLLAFCTPNRGAWFYSSQRSIQRCLCLRYSWTPSHLPSHCVCSHPFFIDHALTCSTGGYPTITHNALRDFTAKIMSEVCHDVPHLQTLKGETFTHATANTADAVCLDISALSFWDNRYQWAFFDVRVFNPIALCNSKLQIPSAH